MTAKELRARLDTICVRGHGDKEINIEITDDYTSEVFYGSLKETEVSEQFGIIMKGRANG